MSRVIDFETWLEQLPDVDIDGFEDAVQGEGVTWAKAHNDVTAEACLTSFFSDNPHEWAENAFDSICSNCKGDTEARVLIMTIVDKALTLVNQN